MDSADHYPNTDAGIHTHTCVSIIAYILINNSPTDPIPTDITTQCPRSFSRADGRYRINFTWSVPFSAAVLCAVNNFRLTTSQVDQNGRTQPFTFDNARRTVLPNVSLKPITMDMQVQYYLYTQFRNLRLHDGNLQEDSYTKLQNLCGYHWKNVILFSVSTLALTLQDGWSLPEYLKQFCPHPAFYHT